MQQVVRASGANCTIRQLDPLGESAALFTLLLSMLHYYIYILYTYCQYFNAIYDDNLIRYSCQRISHSPRGFFVLVYIYIYYEYTLLCTVLKVLKIKDRGLCIKKNYRFLMRNNLMKNINIDDGKTPTVIFSKLRNHRLDICQSCDD